ncbi:MAG: hypothetical protein FJX34_04030, partial [Alphaproteobacteria bacterium]|nr:hypothetical protein [Alphaproteobacteria bacterium]
MLDILLKLLVKKSKKFPRSSGRPEAKVPDEDFIPYVCHYDPNTILTKDGELLQVIRITGFSSNSTISELISLRETIRDAVASHIKENKFALWFNTIRRIKNVDPRGNFTNFFAKKVNEEWIKGNEWNSQYVNEIYITVITEGLDTSIANQKSFLRSFSYFATKLLHRNFLKKSHNKLLQITTNILKETQEYGGKLLGLKEWDGIIYSEPMRFFGKIVNLYEERYPLTANDISSELVSHKIAFGDREIEVVGCKNKNFAAMFSLKEYFEVSTELLDHILQLQFEFIITQSFDFVTSRHKTKQQEYQDYILHVSGDEDLRQASGIADFVDSKKGNLTDYGEQQITLMVISHDKKELDKDVKIIYEKFAALGFVLVREDIFSEHCFWSQLPANFRYLVRQKILNTSHIAGFAALHDFPSGSIAGNHWGPAVTVLRTVLNTPYFFNFHYGNIGHSLIIGPRQSGKTALINFLLTQSQRFNSKIFYLDFNSSSKCFSKAMGGSYYNLSDQEVSEALHLNPMLLANNEHKRFLTSFFTSLVTFSKEAAPSDELQTISQIVDRILAANVKSFSEAVEIFNTPETRVVYERLKIWGKGGKLENIFDWQDEIDWSKPVTVFDLQEVEEYKPILIPIVAYLLYRIEMMLDGSPTIMVLNEAWHIFDNAILGQEFKQLLTRLQQKNCVAILTTSDFAEVEKSEISTGIADQIQTKIFTANAEPHQCYKSVFSVTDDEVDVIKMMAQRDPHFLMKHSNDSLIIKFDLSQYLEI